MIQSMEAKKIKIEKQVDVLQVYSSVIDEYWPLVDFMLREGLKYDGDPMSIDDLKNLKYYRIKF